MKHSHVIEFKKGISHRFFIIGRNRIYFILSSPLVIFSQISSSSCHLFGILYHKKNNYGTPYVHLSRFLVINKHPYINFTSIFSGFFNSYKFLKPFDKRCYSAKIGKCDFYNKGFQLNLLSNESLCPVNFIYCTYTPYP